MKFSDWRPTPLQLTVGLVCLFLIAICTPHCLAARGSYEVPNPAYAPPTGYYNTATGTGDVLKANLKSIISTGFVARTYGDARYAFALLNQDPNNPGNILLVYNDASVPSTWDSGVTFSREHSFRSHGLARRSG